MSEFLYYELNQTIADLRWHGNRYWYTGGESSSSLPLDSVNRVATLAYSADRIWRETGDTVKYMKNRYTGILTTVDMREFFIVKLRSKLYFRTYV